MIQIHQYPSRALKLAFPLIPNIDSNPLGGSHYSHAGIGGYLELPSINDLYDIPSFNLTDQSVNLDGWTSGRRKFGMIVYILDEDKYYQLKPKYKDTKKIIPWKILEALPDTFRGFLLNPAGFEYYGPDESINWATIEGDILSASVGGTLEDVNSLKKYAAYEDLEDADTIANQYLVGLGAAGTVFLPYGIPPEPSDSWVEVFVKGSFKTVTELEDYITDNASAYLGQICSVTDDNKVYLVIESQTTPGSLALLELGSGGGTGETFQEKITVSLTGGKTFGRYASGDQIESIGKTPKDVILMACFEAIPPIIDISATSSIEFGFAGDATVGLAYSYEIKSLGATLSSLKIDRKRGDGGTWTNILNLTSPPQVTLLNDTLLGHVKYNTDPVYYKLTVEDSATGKSEKIYTFNPSPYVAPSLLASPAPNIGSLTRYKGNNDNIIYTATIKKNSVLVPITSYQLQRKIDNAANWESLGAAVPVTTDVAGSNFSIAVSLTDASAPTNTSVKNANTLKYRIVVSDEYTDSTNPVSLTSLGEQIINFYHRCGIVFVNKNTTITIQDIDNGTNIGDLTSNLLKLQNSNGRVIDPVTAPSSDITYYVFASTAPNLISVKNRTDFGIGGSFGLIAPANAPAFILNGLNNFLATVSYKVYKSSAPGAFTGEKLTFS
jgi:hypothetical protein